MMDKMEHLVFQNLDCEVHYWFRKGSENKWVLFFHGAGVDHEMFQEQFQVFDTTYNLIAWDARGHGMSKLGYGKKFHFKDMISDCMKLYETYNIDKAIIVGQSMGGNLAQDIAYYYPKLVEKLVLIDCTRNTGKLTGLERISLKYSKFIFNCYPWKMLIKQSADACGNKDSVKSYVKRCFENIDKETFIDIMMEVIGCLHYDPEFMFSQPVLLLCGEDDKTGNIKKVATPWAKSDGNCNLYFIQNASHNSNQDNPEQVNRYMKDFLI